MFEGSIWIPTIMESCPLIHVFGDPTSRRLFNCKINNKYSEKIWFKKKFMKISKKIKEN
ncbi:unnamed protein product [Brassica oleracea var. botrytis]